jgi:oligopeptide/dipeptide ABC transporter ATP-binding protein
MPRKKLIEVRGLKTYFDTEAGVAKAVDGLDFDVYEEEILGIVGESGSGKSVTALSITRLIPNPPGRIVAGEIYFKGQNLLGLTYEEMRKIRGNEISMIFQEPMTSLNPVFTIGMQLREVVQRHENVSKDEANDRAIQMLELVGIPDARKRLKEYPHQFSGGMRQRVMIAMSLMLNPSLLIADEPTTALDVTIQAQIIELMLEMKKKHTGASIILITHDLAVVAETCQRVIVMYGGKIQEVADALPLYENPLHPYTQGLMGSIPNPEHEVKGRLTAIRGMVPSIIDLPEGCKFCTRCDKVMAICKDKEPELREIETGRWVRCHLF